MAKQADPKGYWIQQPALDLIVGCGAWSAPLLIFAYFTQASNTRLWATVFYGLALFLNYPHYMATVYRTYRKEEDFRKYRFFTVHVTLLVGLTAVLSHFWPAVLPWIFTVYLTWSPWHYSGQNYGLLMMFARRAGAEPTSKQRWALYGAFVASYVALFLTLHSRPAGDALFRSLGLPAIMGTIGVQVLFALFLLLSAYAMSAFRAQVGMRSLIPCVTLLSTQFIWFLLPTLLSVSDRFQIPQSRYSTGVLAVMHSAQYLWITSYFAKREKGAESTPWKPLAYFGVLILGGIALFIPGPWFASYVLHYDFTSSFLIFTALVNIHHFILDGAIWKLRDGRIASLLLNSRSQLVDAAREGSSAFMATLRWLGSATPASRFVRVAAALILVGLAGVDQVRYGLAIDSSSQSSLQLAQSLNPHDATTLLRLARTQLDSGDKDRGIATWEKAVVTRPQDAALRNELLQFLLAQKEPEKAYELTTEWAKIAPRDVDLLVDRGILALQLGHAEEARSDWEKAVAIDPRQSNAHLYLAGLLDQSALPVQAIPHYAAYLGNISTLPPNQRPPAETIIPVLLKLADCEFRLGRNENAARSYELARRLSIDNHISRLEALSAASEAVFKSRVGETVEALQLYQRALRLDDQLKDRGNEAIDWYNYGVFLREKGYPDRLAYAAMLKSQSLLTETSDAERLAAVAVELKSLERRSAAKFLAVPKDLDATVAESLNVR